MGLSQYENAISYLERALQLSGGIPEDMDYDMNYYLATAYFRNGQATTATVINPFFFIPVSMLFSLSAN